MIDQKQSSTDVWWYQGEPLNDKKIPEWAVGMVYRIMKKTIIEVNYDNKPWIDNRIVYIGKKSLTSTRRKKIGVRAKKLSGTRKTYETSVKQSNWSGYWSSCKELIEDQKAHPELFEKHIIEFCYSKKNMTYLELKYQFLYNVLEKDTYNGNINGSLYRYDTDRQLYEQHLQKMRETVRKPRIKKQIKY